MLTNLLDYNLPHDCIAKYPPANRDGARMLVVGRDEIIDSSILEWASLVPPEALVVVNDSKVFKARLLGQRQASGGRVEFLLLLPLGETFADGKHQIWRAIGRANKPIRVGLIIECEELIVTVLEVLPDGEVVLNLASDLSIEDAIEKVGHIPIPPYLGRNDESIDQERYQTIFASVVGSVAAPTAGLHLSPKLVQALSERKVCIAKSTLHVGIGTFRPVTAADLDAHSMHEERYSISADLADEIAAARERRAPVIAVGTTVVRALESASDAQRPGYVTPQARTTNLLIQPGYGFNVVNGLLTNFHMPRSTLLALVAAFAGLDRVLGAYRTAISRGYKFLSYGDAMWIPQRI